MEINGTTITLPRGHSAWLKFQMFVKDDDDSEEEEYILRPGDVCYFGMKEDVDDDEPLILKRLDGYVLHLLPEDTEGLDFGTYTYDVNITYADGDRQTYIRKAKFKIDKEAHT